MTTNELDHESHLLIQNQHFLNKSSLAKYYSICEAFARISFVNCNFEDLNVVANVFGSCRFQNCTFNQFAARKARFANCHFEGCKITNCDMTRAEFYDTSFRNCEFLGVNLAASDFIRCKLETTRFFESNLYVILVRDVKVWKSKEWVEVNDFSIFEKDSDK
jgi:uncharacterized protein YjbI with pentapeptide repeats